MRNNIKFENLDLRCFLTFASILGVFFCCSYTHDVYSPKLGVKPKPTLSWDVVKISPFLVCGIVVSYLFLLYRRFVNSFVFYGLSLIATNLGGNDYLDFFISGAVEVPAYLLCYVTLTRFGRPRPLAASMTLAGLVLVVLIAIPYGQCCFKFQINL